MGKKCQFIACEQNGQWYIGYALKTEGFPMYSSVNPIFEEKVSMRNVLQVRIS